MAAWSISNYFANKNKMETTQITFIENVWFSFFFFSSISKCKEVSQSFPQSLTISEICIYIFKLTTRYILFNTKIYSNVFEQHLYPKKKVWLFSIHTYVFDFISLRIVHIVRQIWTPSMFWTNEWIQNEKKKTHIHTHICLTLNLKSSSQLLRARHSNRPSVFQFLCSFQSCCFRIYFYLSCRHHLRQQIGNQFDFCLLSFESAIVARDFRQK